MKTIIVHIREGSVAKDVEARLAGKLQKWQLKRLFPDATDNKSIRQYFVTVDDDTAAETVLSDIMTVDGVEEARIPPPRAPA